MPKLPSPLALVFLLLLVSMTVLPCLVCDLDHHLPLFQDMTSITLADWIGLHTITILSSTKYACQMPIIVVSHIQPYDDGRKWQKMIHTVYVQCDLI